MMMIDDAGLYLSSIPSYPGWKDDVISWLDYSMMEHEPQIFYRLRADCDPWRFFDEIKLKKIGLEQRLIRVGLLKQIKKC